MTGGHKLQGRKRKRILKMDSGPGPQPVKDLLSYTKRHT